MENGVFGVLPDSWLGEQLGCEAGRIGTGPESEPLAMWRRRPGPGFLSAKIKPADPAGLAALQREGFHVVDVLQTFAMRITPEEGSRRPDGVTVRDARPEDRTQVLDIASRSLRNSRFHLDPAIAPETATAIKVAWVDNFFAGRRGDRMLVAETPAGVAGFLLLLRLKDHWVIDLIAVDTAAQGRGLGRALLAGTVPDAVAEIHAGTQAANGNAIRFYQSLGGRLVDTTIILHFHRRGAA